MKSTFRQHAGASEETVLVSLVDLKISEIREVEELDAF